jgi:hypothetical protein
VSPYLNPLHTIRVTDTGKESRNGTAGHHIHEVFSLAHSGKTFL